MQILAVLIILGFNDYFMMQSSMGYQDKPKLDFEFSTNIYPQGGYITDILPKLPHTQFVFQ